MGHDVICDVSIIFRVFVLFLAIIMEKFPCSDELEEKNYRSLSMLIISTAPYIIMQFKYTTSLLLYYMYLVTECQNEKYCHLYCDANYR